MSTLVWPVWNTSIWKPTPGQAATQGGLGRPTVTDCALLGLLGASLLALRVSRERYLKIWIAGWAAFVASGLVEHVFSANISARYVPVGAQAAFVLGVGLMSCAVLMYSRSRELLKPMAVITPLLAGFAAARLLLWPDSLPMRVALELGYRIILFTGAIALLRARRGRVDGGAGVRAVSVPFLYLPVNSLFSVPTSLFPGWSLLSPPVTAWFFMWTEIEVGLGMLLMVFAEVRARERRLRVAQALTASATSAQQNGNLTQTALQELRRLTRVKAVWVRAIAC